MFRRWWRRLDSQQVRPRFGTMTRVDGTEVPIVYRPTDDPLQFMAHDAATDEPLVVRPGESISADILGPGQSISAVWDLSQWRE